jgi:hypothetical protein
VPRAAAVALVLALAPPVDPGSAAVASAADGCVAIYDR